MAILHVRNVADDLYKELQERALRERRSLSAEVIHLLQSALRRDDRTPAEVLESIAARRRLRPLANDGPSSLELLREDRVR
jgi:plasmid stability protein